jgi:predicted phage terminase large subunit-like protein
MPKSKIILVGTRYGLNDIYSRIIDMGYDIKIYPAISDGKSLCDWIRPIKDVIRADGKIQLEGLNTLKKHLGSVIFSMQFQNDVSLLMVGNIISHEWIKYYDRVPTGLGEIIISCDPAISKNAGADNTSIIVSGRHNGNIYIIKEITGHFSFKETLDHIESLATKYNPDEVRIEQVGFSEAFITETKARVPNIFIHGIKPRGDKESRLRSVSPMLENGLVYFNNKHGNIVDELLLFPEAEHDDRVDALQIALSFYKNDAGECLIF